MGCRMDYLVWFSAEAIFVSPHYDQIGSSVEEAADNLFFFTVVYLAKLFSIEAT
jgi:hypothetical protein